MKSKTQIGDQWKKHRSTSVRGLASQYNNTRKCQAFYAGDLMAYFGNVQTMDNAGRPRTQMVQFNKVKPYVNAVKGFMAQNRLEAKYVARMDNEAGEQYSLYANALKNYVRSNTNADQEETAQNGDMLINGYGALATAMTYGDGFATTDPNGEIISRRIDPLRVGWDPKASRPNLQDARYVYYWNDYALDEAMSLFSDAEESDFESANEGEDDGGYEFFPRGGRYDKIRDSVDWSNQEENLVKVYFYEWFEIEDFYRCENPIYTMTNPQAVQLVAMQLEQIAAEVVETYGLFTFDPRAEILTFDKKTREKIKELLDGVVEIFTYRKKVFYTAAVSGSHVFSAYPSICQQGFSLKFKTGDYDAKNKIWVGMVNSMMDPAIYFNAALTQLMFIIATNSKGGVIIEEDAVQDVQDFEQKYATADGVIVVNPGAVSGGKIRSKREPVAATGYEGLLEITNAALSDVNGIDPSFLGSSENKLETAALQRQRVKQVTSTLACYFDADSLFLKENARMLLDFLKVYAENNDGRLFSVIEQNGRQNFLRISADPFMAEYDVVISEAPRGAEEDEEQAQIMMQMADRLLTVGDTAAGKQALAVAINKLRLDRADKAKLLQALQTQAPDPAYIAQLEQQVQMLTSQAAQVDMQAKMAQAQEREANARGKIAATAKTIAETRQKEIENNIMRSAPMQNVNVSV